MYVVCAHARAHAHHENPEWNGTGKERNGLSVQYPFFTRFIKNGNPCNGRSTERKREVFCDSYCTCTNVGVNSVFIMYLPATLEVLLRCASCALEIHVRLCFVCPVLCCTCALHSGYIARDIAHSGQISQTPCARCEMTSGMVCRDCV